MPLLKPTMGRSQRAFVLRKPRWARAVQTFRRGPASWLPPVWVGQGGNPHALGHWCKASEAMLLQPSMSAWATFDDNVQRAGPDGAKALLPLAGASLQWISACRRAASHPPRRRPRPGMAGTRQLTGRPVCLSRSELVDHSISQHDPHILMIVSTSSLGCMPSPTPFKLDTRAL